MTAEFVPSPEQRKLVKTMAAFGIPQLDIAEVVGVSDRTLRKAFREELDRGVIEANLKVAETCFRMATSGKVPAATFFWLKARAGWREVIRQEDTGGDGGPIKVAAAETRLISLQAALVEWTAKHEREADAGQSEPADAGV